MRRWNVVLLSDDIICSPSALTSSLRHDVIVIVISTKFTTFIKLCEKWIILHLWVFKHFLLHVFTMHWTIAWAFDLTDLTLDEVLFKYSVKSKDEKSQQDSHMSQVSLSSHWWVEFDNTINCIFNFIPCIHDRFVLQI